jgi:branched-chain amino acid transport system substrate-binding protein
LRIAGAGPCGGSDRAEARLAAAREGAARLFSADAADDFFGVGVLAPLSGDLARYGEALAQGVALAVREHNGRSSVRLGLRVTDTTGDPVRAAAAADSLSRLGVGAVIGDVLSSSTLAAAAALRASGTVLVSPAALEEGIGLVGPGIFQTIVPRHLQGRALADYAVSSLRLRRVAVIHDEADDSARLASAFRSRVRELGGDVVSDLEFRRGEGLFTSLLDEAEWAGARAVLAAGEPSDISELVTQLARRGGGMALLGSEVMGQPEVLAAFSDFDGDAAYVEDYYLLAPDREASFRERYLSAYGVAADRFARLGYVAGLVLAGAYEDGPTDRRALRERLAARVGGDAYLGERRIIEPPGSVATVAVYRITRGEVEQAGP